MKRRSFYLYFLYTMVSVFFRGSSNCKSAHSFRLLINHCFRIFANEDIIKIIFNFFLRLLLMKFSNGYFYVPRNRQSFEILSFFLLHHQTELAFRSGKLLLKFIRWLAFISLGIHQSLFASLILKANCQSFDSSEVCYIFIFYE